MIQFLERKSHFTQWYAKMVNKINEVNQKMLKIYDAIEKVDSEFKRFEELRSKLLAEDAQNKKTAKELEDSKKNIESLNETIKILKDNNELSKVNDSLTQQNNTLINQK